MIDWSETTAAAGYRSGDFTTDAMLQTVRRVREQEADRKEAAFINFSLMVCDRCGARVIYHKSPESITVCRCVWDELKKLPEVEAVTPPALMGDMGGLPRLHGMRVNVSEPMP